ncbi:MAG: hypothetical protein IJP32_11970 [Clostridia bacterium]|nr:hypothetical protein [Clostridia bacterium]
MTPSFCVISQDVPEEMRENLRQSFDDVIPLPPDDELAAPVACHPDMIFAVLDGCMFLSARYYARNTAGIDRIASLGGLTVCPVSVNRNERYPNDVAFNIAVWRDAVICRPDAACRALLDFAEKRGYRIIPVKQGYAGCSCLSCSDAVRTFDRGIKKSLDSAGIPCILLGEGGIALPGYDSGFLGGAGGFHDGVIYLYGNADTLPCADQLALSGYRLVSLSGGRVTDYGGIKPFRKR